MAAIADQRMQYQKKTFIPDICYNSLIYMLFQLTHLIYKVTSEIL